MKKELPLIFLLMSSIVAAGTTTTTTVQTTAPVPVQVEPATAAPSTVIINNNVSAKPVISDADSSIISGIYARYSKESALTGTNLNISSDNGIVTISGNVTQQSQAEQAIAVAKAYPGVKTVISKITVLTNPNASVTPEVKNY